MDIRAFQRPRARRRLGVGTAVVLVVALLLAACGSGEDSAAGFSDEPADFEVPEMAPSAADAAERGFATADGGGIEPVPPILPGAPTGRHVVRSAEVAIETFDTTEAVDDVIGVAERAGGYAATIDVSRSTGGIVSGWVTLRVPADRLEAVVAEIEAVGETVLRSRIDEYDVTMEYVDVEARLGNLRAFEDELLALLTEVRESSPDAENLLRVFERIREVRAEIDQLEARQTALSDQISMATVHVNISQRRTAAEVTWGPGSTVRDAFAATVRLLTNVADGIIWAVVTVLPIAIAVLALPAIVIWRLLRRRSHRRNLVETSPSGSASDEA